MVVIKTHHGTHKSPICLNCRANRKKRTKEPTFIPPKMTTTQRNDLKGPCIGMLLEDEKGHIFVYTSDGWIDLGKRK